MELNTANGPFEFYQFLCDLMASLPSLVTFYTKTQKSEMWDPSQRCTYRLSAVDGCAENFELDWAQI